MNFYYKIFLLLLFVSVTHTTTGQSVFKTKYVPSAYQNTIEGFFKDIEQNTKIPISYSDLALPLHTKITLSANRRHTLETSLQEILKGLDVQAIESENRILIIPVHKAQNTEFVTISGFVREKSSNEIIIGAWLQFSELGLSVYTNQFGFYTIQIPAGDYNVNVYAIGYELEKANLNCRKTKEYAFKLTSKTNLEEIKIISERIREVEDGRVKTLKPTDIYRLNYPFGEPDVLRRIQHEPGVTTGIEGTTGLRVRGSDPGQNLNLLDGVPIYYVDHLYGVSSVFHSDAIKSVDFYKSAFPARYGGRLASIVDVQTKDGDMQQFKGNVGLSLLNGSVGLEGPIIKNKASYSISGRRTWADAVMPYFIDDLNFYFYDFNAKFNAAVNDKNRIYVSAYVGGDKIQENDSVKHNSSAWGNKVGSIRWTSVLNPKLFLNTTASLSNFNYNIQDKREEIRAGQLAYQSDYRGVSNIKEWSIRTDATYYRNKQHTWEFGAILAQSKFEPTKLITNQNSLPTHSEFNMQQLSFYVQDVIKWRNRVEVMLGLHYSNWRSETFNYHSPQPRAAIVYRPSVNQRLYASFTRMAQFLHLISNNTYGLPSDFWVPSTEKITPEKASQFTFGFSGYRKKWRYTAEVYYKEMDGVTLYNSGKDIFDNSKKWQDRILQGKGWSYGLETQLQKSWKKVNWLTSYTLSWSWREFENLNNNNPFPYRYDRRHNFRTSLEYLRNQHWRWTLAWCYLSGEAFTLPDQIYPDFDQNIYIQPSSAISSSDYTYEITSWNNYRLPAIHHLDFSVSYVTKPRKRIKHEVNFGINNLYARPNVWFAKLVNNEETNQLELKGYSYTNFLPFISYKIYF